MNLKQIFSKQDSGVYSTSFYADGKTYYASVRVFEDGDFDTIDFYYIDDETTSSVDVSPVGYEDVIARSLKEDLKFKY